jgi:hypothetical protein
LTTDQVLTAAAVHSWKLQIDRADKFFSGLSETQLQSEIAPGKNRLVYLWGHLIAVHDAMLPLLDIEPRQHPALDEPFLKAKDREVAPLPETAELKRAWDDVNARLLKAFEGFTPADWVAKHTAVSVDDFKTSPLRNRLSVLMSRTGHIAYHLGQAQLAPK